MAEEKIAQKETEKASHRSDPKFTFGDLHIANATI